MTTFSKNCLNDGGKVTSLLTTGSYAMTKCCHLQRIAAASYYKDSPTRSFSLLTVWYYSMLVRCECEGEVS